MQAGACAAEQHALNFTGRLHSARPAQAVVRVESIDRHATASGSCVASTSKSGLAPARPGGARTEPVLVVATATGRLASGTGVGAIWHVLAEADIRASVPRASDDRFACEFGIDTRTAGGEATDFGSTWAASVDGSSVGGGEASVARVAAQRALAALLSSGLTADVGGAKCCRAACRAV